MKSEDTGGVGAETFDSFGNAAVDATNATKSPVTATPSQLPP